MKILLIACIYLFSVDLNAQSSADSLYLAGKKAAQAGEYTLAIMQLEQLLSLRPDDYDAQTYLARVYYWKKDFSKSISLLEPALKRVPSDSETQLLYLEVLLADQKTPVVLNHIATLPSSMQEQAAFKYTKIKALHQSERHKEALEAINSFLVSTPDHLQARQLQQVLARLVARQAILIDLEMSSFNVPLDNWYSLAVGYENRLKQGPLQLRLHFANRFQQTAAQFEADFYPRINEKTTGYFGFGLSNNTLFPGFRLGAEIYRSLPHAWEISAGLRHLSFKNNPLTTYTLAGTKYIGSYYFSLRPFIIPFQGSVYLTSSLSTRRYFKDSRHYVGLSAGIGNSPDMDFRLNDPNLEALNPDLYLLDAFSLRLDYQRPFKNQLILKPFLEYRQEEFQPANYRSRTSFGLSITRNF